MWTTPKTVYNGGAGTDQLTRVQNGSRQIRFLLEEVLALAEQQEQRGQPKPCCLDALSCRLASPTKPLKKLVANSLIECSPCYE
jgi:hypothetical protein